MREIKFRAWDTENSRMIVDFLNQAGWDAKLDMNNAWYMDKYIPLQYTGLKDKNGVEIYEGDVIQIDDPEDRSTGTIVYSRGCFGREYNNEGGATVFIWLGDPENWRVIGNIYENPELLT